MDAVVKWSAKKKMVINVEKSEITFFSIDTKEAKWRPNIKALAKDVPFNPTPKFLGVHLDRTLSFAKHVKVVTDKVKSRNRMLASLTSKKWSWKKRSMRKVYTTMQKNVMDYTSVTVVSGITVLCAASEFVLHRCNSAGTLVYNQCDTAVTSVWQYWYKSVTLECQCKCWCTS